MLAQDPGARRAHGAGDRRARAGSDRGVRDRARGDREHRGDLGVRSNRGQVGHPERAPATPAAAGRAVAFGRARGAGRGAAEGQPGAVLAGVGATRVREPPRRRRRRRRRARRRPRSRTAGLGIEAAVGWLESAGAVGRGVAADRARVLRRRARLGAAASPSPAWATDAELPMPTAARTVEQQLGAAGDRARLSRRAGASSLSVGAGAGSRGRASAAPAPDIAGIDEEALVGAGVGGRRRRRAAGVARGPRRRRAGRVDLCPTTAIRFRTARRRDGTGWPSLLASAGSAGDVLVVRLDFEPVDQQRLRGAVAPDPRPDREAHGERLLERGSRRISDDSWPGCTA